MQRAIENGYVCFAFRGLSDMADYVDNMTCEFASSHETVNNRYSGKEFYGGKEYREYICDVRYGNAEAAQLFSGRVDELESMIKAEKDGMVADVSGDILDIGAYLDGTPECFRRKSRIEAKPVIRIAVDMGFLGNVDGFAINNRGVAIVALVNELQQNGYGVQMTIYNKTNFDYSKISGYKVRMDIACDPIDISELSCICHPCFKRRLCFALVESELGCHGANSEGYGRSTYALYGVEYDIAFAGSGGSEWRSDNFKTLERTKDHVLGMMDEFRRNGSVVG